MSQQTQEPLGAEYVCHKRVHAIRIVDFDHTADPETVRLRFGGGVPPLELARSEVRGLEAGGYLVTLQGRLPLFLARPGLRGGLHADRRERAAQGPGVRGVRRMTRSSSPPSRPPAPPALTVSLEELEQKALDSEYKTVPGAYGSVLVGGQDLLALVRLLRFYSQARCGCINTQLCETWGAHNAV